MPVKKHALVVTSTLPYVRRQGAAGGASCSGQADMHGAAA